MADDFRKFKRRFNKAKDKAVKKVAEEMTFKIEQIYESTIEKFYSKYTPHCYARTERTFYGSDSYSVLQDPVAYDGGYIAGIEVSPDNIPGNPYRADKGWVFERTFVKGYHGYTKEEVDEWRSREHIKKLISMGKYHFRYYASMKPSFIPANVVEKEVRKLSKSRQVKSELINIFTQELTKELNMKQY